MEILITAVNKIHVALGWATVLVLAVLMWRRKGDMPHRRLGKAALVLIAIMAMLAAGYVIYRLFGGRAGPAGFSILGVNKLAFPLYMFFTAYLFVRSGTTDASRFVARNWAAVSLVAAIVAGTSAAIITGERPYLSGRVLYTLEINLTDLLVAAIVPLMFATLDLRWKFAVFSRADRIGQHGLRMAIGTVFLLYAAAPWNHLTNAIYSALFGPVGLGHVLLYTGSPFFVTYLLFRFHPPTEYAVRRLVTAWAAGTR